MFKMICNSILKNEHEFIFHLYILDNKLIEKRINKHFNNYNNKNINRCKNIEFKEYIFNEDKKNDADINFSDLYTKDNNIVGGVDELYYYILMFYMQQI
jgi:hypothetical protein